MRKIDKIKQSIKSQKEYLRKTYRVKEIGIFGSYIHGKQQKKSDLDILVDFYEKPDFFEYMEIEEFLSKILKTKVDLVLKSALKPYIGKHILQEVIYI